MTIRVNWNQGKASILQVHRIVSSETPQCQFSKMVDFTDYATLDQAEAEMRRRNYRSYRRCGSCWDGITVNLRI